MTFPRKAVLLDLGFVTALLGVAAVPLLALKGSPHLHDPYVQLGFASAALALLACWSWARKWWPETASILTRSAGEGPILSLAGASGWYRRLAVAGLLLALTVAAYYLPLRKHFWLGMDEFLSVGRECPSLWDEGYDLGWGRPLVANWIVIARWLTPDRIEGFLLVAVLLCFLNSLMLYALVRRLLPGAPGVALAAAVLFIVNPAESSRFCVFYGTNVYWSALLLLSAATYGFLRAHDRQQPIGLVVSCVVLGCSLLINEAGFPLALLAPLFLVLFGRHRQQRLLWSYAWLVTVTLLAARFVLRLLLVGSHAYQVITLGRAHPPVSVMLGNLYQRFMTWCGYFALEDGWGHHWKTGLAVLLLVGAVFLLMRGASAGLSRRRLLGGMALAATAALLGLAPFLHVIPLVRTRFLAAPGQAVLVACALGLVASLFPRRLGQALLLGVTALLTANATVAALHSQTRAAETATVRFERTAHFIRQFHALAPALAPDTIAVFLLDADTPPPFGRVFDTQHLFMRLFGINATFWNYCDSPATASNPSCVGIVTWRYGWPVRPDGSILLSPKDRFDTYDHVVIFQLRRDGTLALLRELPCATLPGGCKPPGYDPLARIRPGPLEEPPFFRYASWMQRPLEVVPAAEGLGLGKGWSLLECRGMRACCYADHDAELVVNPAGRRCVTVPLELECLAETPGAAHTLLVVNDVGDTVASQPVTGRQVVQFTLPMESSRLTVFRLRLLDAAGSSTTGPVLRVFAPGHAAPGHWQFPPR